MAVATSTGLLSFYHLSAADGVLAHVRTKRICDASTLVLSLCWHPSRADVLGVTLSTGEVCICQSTTGGDDKKLWTGDTELSLTVVHQHSLEAWMVAFTSSPSQAEDVLSGGDDQGLYRSSISNAGDNDRFASTQLWQDHRIHKAGVTAILPLSQDLILTGSYDDHLRLLSAPSIGRRRVLAEANLGGGVWRLKLLNAAASVLSDTNGYVPPCS